MMRFGLRDWRGWPMRWIGFEQAGHTSGCGRYATAIVSLSSICSCCSCCARQSTATYFTPGSSDQVPDFRSSPPGDQCDDQVCTSGWLDWSCCVRCLILSSSCMLLQYCCVPAQHAMHEVSKHRWPSRSPCVHGVYQAVPAVSISQCLEISRPVSMQVCAIMTHFFIRPDVCRLSSGWVVQSFLLANMWCRD